MASSNFIDMTGWVMKEHGVLDSRLSVIERICEGHPKYIHKKSIWKCKCECGNTDYVYADGYSLRKGKTKSCGCYKSDRIRNSSKKTNTYKFTDTYGIGYDSNNQEFYFDLEDYDKIKDYCWIVSDSGYVITAIYNSELGFSQNYSMHRLLMDVTWRYNKDDKLVIDHINHVRFDNRKQNLRVCLWGENLFNKDGCNRNTSGVCGVSWSKEKKKWRAYISIGGHQKFLGYYADFDKAVDARKQGEEKFFGQFSYDNSIQISKSLEEINYGIHNT